MLEVLLSLVIAPLFAWHRILCYLQLLQQDEYDARRLLRWVWGERAFDRKASAALLILPMPLAATGMLGIAWWEGDPRRHGKLPLQMTARAQRIAWAGLATSLVSLLIVLALPMRWLALLVWVQSIPLQLAAVSAALWPSEQRVQSRYMQQACRRLREVDPYIIGITGSYGKTTTKALLGEVLQVTLGNTFWPAKGTNTVMGITREVRERLRPCTDYAVIEMGAYRKGSIARVCRLTPPRAAIITAVDAAHLERFGSREAIFEAKSELAQAVPDDGILVCCADDPGARRMAETYPKQTTLLYGEAADTDCRLVSWKTTLKGSHFTLEWKGERYRGSTPMLGLPILRNIAGAFTMACALGADPEFVLAMVASVPPVDNRLELKRYGSVTYLRDAYNSNPHGFRGALDVLRSMPGERKILVTPGVIELDEEQDEANRSLAQSAGQSCDLLLQVGTTNREAWLTGAEGVEVRSFDHRDDALGFLQEIQQEGDVVLLENDLTDVHESRRRF